MRLREFDEKEQLLKANEKLTKYKTAAGADAAAADASGNFARGHKRFKGINAATKKQFANDAKLAKLKEFADQGVAEAFANPGSGSTGTSRGAKRIANTVRKALAKNSETPDQIAARKDFEAQTDARMRQKKKEQGVAEGSESDAYGNTGEKHECGSCDGTGIDTHDDECPECGGKGWVRDKESSKKKGVAEEWSQKYKKSINCSHPKGFSQKAHCAGKQKHNESIEMEMVCEDCGMCQSHGSLNEIAKGAKDANSVTKCWPGKHAEGTKTGKNGGQVRNCVPNESVAEDSLAAMRRLAGVTTPLPAAVPNGPRQYRHMPTAVQPR